MRAKPAGNMILNRAEMKINENAKDLKRGSDDVELF